jgi:glc operon protein GlcG
MAEADQIIETASISLRGAEAVLAGARAAATQRATPVSIAVLDRGGHLVGFLRMDGSHAGTAAVATAKARTAVLYNRPTAMLAAGVASGNLALLSLPDVVALPGGVPISGASGLLGAVGVSGAAPEVDEAIAQAGAACIVDGKPHCQ